MCKTRVTCDFDGFVLAAWITSCIIKVTAQVGCRDTGRQLGTPAAVVGTLAPIPLFQKLGH